MLTVDPFCGFKPGAPLLGIQHPNHQQQLIFLIPSLLRGNLGLLSSSVATQIF